MDAPNLLGLTLAEARSVARAGYPDVVLNIIYYSSPVSKSSFTVCNGVYRVVRQRLCGSNELEVTVSLFRTEPQKNH